MYSVACGVMRILSNWEASILRIQRLVTVMPYARNLSSLTFKNLCTCYDLPLQCKHGLSCTQCFFLFEIHNLGIDRQSWSCAFILGIGLRRIFFVEAVAVKLASNGLWFQAACH